MMSRVFQRGVFFFLVPRLVHSFSPLFFTSFTDVSGKVSALCNWSLQPRGPSCSLPVLVRAKQRVEFGHIPGFLQKPLSVNLTFHTSRHTSPSGAACSADVLVQPSFWLLFAASSHRSSSLIRRIICQADLSASKCWGHAYLSTCQPGLRVKPYIRSERRCSLYVGQENRM